MHASPRVRLYPMAPRQVHWQGGFWGERFSLCRDRALDAMERILRETPRGASLGNFDKAAGQQAGAHAGAYWSDGDCYKWLEALTHTYAVTGARQTGRGERPDCGGPEGRRLYQHPDPDIRPATLGGPALPRVVQLETPADRGGAPSDHRGRDVSAVAAQTGRLPARRLHAPTGGEHVMLSRDYPERWADFHCYCCPPPQHAAHVGVAA